MWGVQVLKLKLKYSVLVCWSCSFFAYTQTNKQRVSAWLQSGASWWFDAGHGGPLIWSGVLEPPGGVGRWQGRAGVWSLPSRVCICVRVHVRACVCSFAGVGLSGRTHMREPTCRERQGLYQLVCVVEVPHVGFYVAPSCARQQTEGVQRYFHCCFHERKGQTETAAERLAAVTRGIR